jgi:nucleoside-diphosphate-sugar epimerase
MVFREGSMIFISGGGSFVGRAVIRTLDEQSITYSVISRSRIYDKLDDYLESKGCRTFIHCAWSMDYENPNNNQENDKLNKMILDGTKGVDNFIFISSIHVLIKKSAYTQDKIKWENMFFDSANKQGNKMSIMYLPHLIAPEVGLINKNSVIYKFYNNWKMGKSLDVYNDQDIHYTDLKSFKDVLLQILLSQGTLKLVPKFNIASISHIKSEFLSNKALCPIIERLKKSDI